MITLSYVLGYSAGLIATLALAVGLRAILITRLKMPKENSHNWFIRTVDGVREDCKRYVAVCECGWISKPWPDVPTADDDAADHVVAVTRSYGPRVPEAPGHVLGFPIKKKP